MLEIKGKEREHKFGIGFLRELNAIYRLSLKSSQGMSAGIGGGLILAQAELEIGNPDALSNILYASLSKIDRQSVTISDVDAAIETFAEEGGDLKTLADQVSDCLKKSKVLQLSQVMN